MNTFISYLDSIVSAFGDIHKISYEINNNYVTIFINDYFIRITDVHVKNIRPKYSDLSDWMKDSNNVYMGRKNVVFVDGKRFPVKDSLFANPYKCSNAASKYQEYLFACYNNGIITKEDVLNLKNKTIGCWCYSKGNICHTLIVLNLLLLIDD